jgi:hypothetical protein
MSRRLSDRIRKLCSDIVAARDEDVEPSLTELKSALREHTARLRKMAATKLADANLQPEERRSHTERRSDSEAAN